MKRILFVLLILLLSYQLSFSKDVQVKGYYRKDGTYVKSSTRSSPGSGGGSSDYGSSSRSYDYDSHSKDYYDSGGSDSYYDSPHIHTNTYIDKKTKSDQGTGNTKKNSNSTGSYNSESHIHTNTYIDKGEVKRDPETGRIERSDAARHEFMKMTGFPNGRPGYIIDHVIPLACGGPDDPSNMQWQTVEEAKEKDKWERKNCDQYFSH